jgi:ABC-2 type transport system ATP-binding protein
LEVSEGNVYGILGPNGSGKTTTLGMILNVVKPTSGSYQWFGKNAHQQARKSVGAILEMPAFYPYLSAVRNLQVIARIKEKGADRIDQVLEQVGLFDRRNDKFKTYSLGMKQRLSIASALLADPPVLILDEPTNGLDPQGIAEIRELIISIAAQGKTILFASHILDEVQKVCTHFAVLKMGKKIYDGSVEEAMKQKQIIELKTENLESLQQELAGFNAMENLSIHPGHLEVRLTDTSNILDLHRFLIEKGIVLTHLSEQKISLEKKFLSILKESNDQTA